MATDFTTTGRIVDGVGRMRNYSAWERWCQEQKSGEFIMRVEKASARRSGAQNAYLWAVVNRKVCYALMPNGKSLNDLGWTVDDVHDYLKSRFLPKHLTVIDGNGVVEDERVIGGSTAKLSKEAFSEYVKAIQEWAAGLGIVIEDPDPYWRERLEAER